MENKDINQKLSNTIIFISNTTLDGFREGDGDLMDKLTIGLNNNGVNAVRVIGNAVNIPDDKQHLVHNHQLVSLCGEKRELDLKILQNKFLDVINNPLYNDKHKILYIGSRLRAIQGTNNQVLFSESGALFDKKFINILKEMNIKVVVCALEFKFFKRSYAELERCYYTLDQHFFLADKIHFLTKLDKKDFEETVEKFEKNTCLSIIDEKINIWGIKRTKELNDGLLELGESDYARHMRAVENKKVELASLSNASSPARISCQKELTILNKQTKQVQGDKGKLAQAYMLKKDSFNSDLKNLTTEIRKSSTYMFDSLNTKELNRHKNKGVFISGIYTIAPLTENEILKIGEKLKIDGKNKIDILCNRPTNILNFGLIRGQKGIDEAIELAELLKKEGSKIKVIIAGKLFVDLNMVKNIFCRIFKVERSQFSDELHEALILRGNENIKGGKNNLQDIEKAIAENKNIKKFNDFCISFYKKLAAEKQDCVTNIEVHFNVEEEKLRELAMQCKYAIKFDNKGMANNASTIVSCLGFYLPTVTTQGLLTSEEFIQSEKNQEKKPADYSMTLIMLQKEAYSVNNNGELVPVNPSMQEVIDLIQNDEKNYRSRLEVLERLHKDKVFDCDEACRQLIDNIFLPLADELNTMPVINESVIQSTQEPMYSLSEKTGSLSKNPLIEYTSYDSPISQNNSERTEKTVKKEEAGNTIQPEQQGSNNSNKK